MATFFPQTPIPPAEAQDENEKLLVSLNEAYADSLDAAEIDVLSQMRLHQLHLLKQEANDVNQV